MIGQATRDVSSAPIELCGNPCCNLPDRHKSACSVSFKSTRRILVASPPIVLHDGDNIFQLRKAAVRTFMSFNLGVIFTMNTKALNEHWLDDFGKYYDATYKITSVSHNQSFVASGVSANDMLPFEFGCAAFLDSRTTIRWNPLPTSIWKSWRAELASNPKYANSMARAREFMREYLRLCTCSASDIIVMLDGDGSNRMSCVDELLANKVPSQQWPKIIAFDMDPEVALANRMLFGAKFGHDSIVFTGSDPNFSSRTLLGRGHLLEHLITKPNDLFTEDMKNRTRAVYFDYCGGPPGNQNPAKCRQNFEDNIFPRLPNLAVYAVTMSYRQHKTLQTEGITGFVPPPSSFRNVKSFTQNAHVLCQLFSLKGKVEQSGNDGSAVCRPPSATNAKGSDVRYPFFDTPSEGPEEKADDYLRYDKTAHQFGKFKCMDVWGTINGKLYCAYWHKKDDIYFPVEFKPCASIRRHVSKSCATWKAMADVAKETTDVHAYATGTEALSGGVALTMDPAASADDRAGGAFTSVLKRPRGRAPRNKVWSSTRGWVDVCGPDKTSDHELSAENLMLLHDQDDSSIADADAGLAVDDHDEEQAKRKRVEQGTVFTSGGGAPASRSMCFSAAEDELATGLATRGRASRNENREEDLPTSGGCISDSVESMAGYHLVLNGDPPPVDAPPAKPDMSSDSPILQLPAPNHGQLLSSIEERFFGQKQSGSIVGRCHEMEHLLGIRFPPGIVNIKERIDNIEAIATANGF